MSEAGYDRDRSGFTLLEILIAIFIFAIVISAVYGSYVTMLKSVDSTESRVDIDNKARIAMERITADLESVFLGQGGFLKGRKQEIQGNGADTLDFTSSAHLVFSQKEFPAGLAEIKYTVVQDSDTELLQLYRLDIPFRQGNRDDTTNEEKGFLLCDGLKSVRFLYSARDQTEVEDWESEKETGQVNNEPVNIPRMVTIELVFASTQDSESPRNFKTAVALPTTDESEN